MAGSSFLALFDDIAAVLDDVSVMTKVAAKKTAGVLGDDLALNAQQVSGVPVNRELPVVWAVAKGSFLNKLILVPSALLISAFAPWAVTPLLMVGGAYLCFEGFEKLAHKFLHRASSQDDKQRDRVQALQNESVDMVAFEREKIKGAVRTDFILSAEIIAITLGAVAGADLLRQFLVLAGIALVMTIGVYGLVAGIVKLDDLGVYLSKKASLLARFLGKRIVHAAPYLMKTLSVVGTAAMFMVGGSILTHGLSAVGQWFAQLSQSAGALIGTGGPALQALLGTLLDAGFGVLAGAACLAIVTLFKRLMPRNRSNG